jgi:lactoylglutathione lyase
MAETSLADEKQQKGDGEAMKIDHVGLYVNDLEGARDFFERYFGGKSGSMYHNHATGLSTYFVTLGGGTRIELMNKPDVTATSNGMHIAINVGSKKAVDEKTAMLREAGFEVLDGPRTTGDGYYESSVEIFEELRIELTE